MNPRLLIAGLLFLSSYAPLGIILAVLDFDRHARTFAHPEAALLVLALTLVATALPFAILRRRSGGELYTVGPVNNRSVNLVTYALPYLVTFVSLRLDDYPSLIAFGLFMVLFCVLAIKTQVLWLNPLLALGGFSLYETTLRNEGGESFTAFVLSAMPLKPGQHCRADCLTNNQVYVTDPNPDGQLEGAV
jgi:hypothetical protein